MMQLNFLSAGLVFAISFALSAIGVEFFRRWSLNRDLLDVPNERSSHSAPTPRGGGLIIVLVCLAVYVLLHFLFSTPFSFGYFIGALLVALVSWLDDLYSLPFWARLIVHIAAGVVLISDLGVWQDIAIPFISFELTLGSFLGGIATVLWVVWLLNAYNFMDGIDGIAALQAAIAGLAWAATGLALEMTGLFLFGGVLASTSLGFLIHNWHPAKIFMGDVGSSYLGFTLAALPLLAGKEMRGEIAVLPSIAVVFVWFFLFDTVYTLARRLLNGERVWEAHRGHLYQRMVIGGLSHYTVTLGYAAAAAILSVSVVFLVVFGGNFAFLTLCLLVALTAGQLYLGSRKKH